MSYEDRVIHLLTYLRTDFRSPRSVAYTTSEPRHGPEIKSTSVTECTRILKLIWHVILIGILGGLLILVVLMIIVEWHTNQSLLMRIEQLKEEMKNKTEKLMEENNRLTELLNISNTNYSILLAKYNLLANKVPCDLSHLEAEILRLQGVLRKAVQAKEQGDREVKQLNAQLKPIQDENRRLEVQSTRLKSMLSSKRLEYIWDLCDKTTLRCSRCLPRWKEHASRCFFLQNVEKNWENARRECLGYKGDLAVVLNKEDQTFLTNMTFNFKRRHPSTNVISVWIGLQDLVKEGVHFWVNGERIKWDVTYWKTNEPNNAIASWDTDGAGQDCVSIIPPAQVGPEGWLNSWDDITCVGKRHYICETDALILT